MPNFLINNHLGTSCPSGDNGNTIGCLPGYHCVGTSTSTLCLPATLAKNLIIDDDVLCGIVTSDLCQDNCAATGCISDD